MLSAVKKRTAQLLDQPDEEGGLMRTPLIAANWKMHKTVPEAVAMLRDLLDRLGGQAPTDRRVLICPPFTALSAVRDVLDGTGIFWGAQNMHPAEEGAFTGEISARMLTDLGCSYVIIGHSERRHIFGESDAFINQKVHAAFAHGLTPILAVGEKIEQRRAGEHEAVVEAQLAQGLEGVSAEQARTLVIAYEPVWAIGTGETATPEDAQAMHAFIRGWLAARFGDDVAQQVIIQYGGSVKPNNVDALMAQPDIDGALVGGASLHAESFARIIQFQ
ncbi:triosephosphate isomerase [Ardenticatena maritima]|uniref:Triosephosphate isomerase n=2 Tax=Ardenticatena maritima TaxID=872965 RepID=A0A0M9UBH2_9CHLR|nr:triosephosphate isomerase [Ardenticatena maritima]